MLILTEKFALSFIRITNSGQIQRGCIKNLERKDPCGHWLTVTWIYFHYCPQDPTQKAGCQTKRNIYIPIFLNLEYLLFWPMVNFNLNVAKFEICRPIQGFEASGRQPQTFESQMTNLKVELLLGRNRPWVIKTHVLVSKSWYRVFHIITYPI